LLLLDAAPPVSSSHFQIVEHLSRERPQLVVAEASTNPTHSWFPLNSPYLIPYSESVLM